MEVSGEVMSFFLLTSFSLYIPGNTVILISYDGKDINERSQLTTFIHNLDLYRSTWEHPRLFWISKIQVLGNSELFQGGRMSPGYWTDVVNWCKTLSRMLSCLSSSSDVYYFLSSFLHAIPSLYAHMLTFTCVYVRILIWGRTASVKTMAAYRVGVLKKIANYASDRDLASKVYKELKQKQTPKWAIIKWRAHFKNRE